MILIFLTDDFIKSRIGKFEEFRPVILTKILLIVGIFWILTVILEKPKQGFKKQNNPLYVYWTGDINNKLDLYDYNDIVAF